MLEINNLKVEIDGEEVLQGVSVHVGRGEKVLLMGPNGSGKTSLARVLLGDARFKIISGEVTAELDGQKLNLLKLSPEDRARKRLFVGFQAPVEIPGVSFYDLLFQSSREIKTEDSQNEVLEMDEFYDRVDEIAGVLSVDKNLLSRGVNENMSGGEKKKMELLQMVVLKPRLVILDEPDSGMDADSVKYIRKALDLLDKNTSVLLISHDPSRLGISAFDKVLVMKRGKIVKEGRTELIKQVSKEGYDKI